MTNINVQNVLRYYYDWSRKTDLITRNSYIELVYLHAKKLKTIRLIYAQPFSCINNEAGDHLLHLIKEVRSHLKELSLT